MIGVSFVFALALASSATAQAPMSEAQTGVFGAGGMKSQPSGTQTPEELIAQIIGDIPNFTTEDNSGGSGPYKAFPTEIPGLPRHTVIAPKERPAGVPLQVIVWGEGGCGSSIGGYKKFLAEVASYGFFVVANGHTGMNATSAQDLPSAMDWVYQNAGKGEYSTVDKTKIAAAGQSCGGIQAMSASLDKRVTVSAIFNSGLLNPDNTPLFEKLHAPVGYFIGGPKDIAYENVSKRYFVG